MPYRYIGRADTLILEEGGKAYHHGDIVPISKSRAEALMRSSRLHDFEGLDAPDEPQSPPATTPAQAEAPKKS